MVRLIPSNADCKARIQAARNVVAAKPRSPKKKAAMGSTVYMVFKPKAASSSSCGCSNKVNFNKYANKIIANPPKSLPKPSSPRFANKVKTTVKQMYRTNHPNLPNLNNNSSYIQMAVKKLRAQLNRIRSANSNANTPARRRSPPKPSVAIKSTIQRQTGKTGKTKALFKDRRKKVTDAAKLKKKQAKA